MIIPNCALVVLRILNLSLQEQWLVTNNPKFESRHSLRDPRGSNMIFLYDSFYPVTEFSLIIKAKVKSMKCLGICIYYIGVRQLSFGSITSKPKWIFIYEKTLCGIVFTKRYYKPVTLLNFSFFLYGQKNTIDSGFDDTLVLKERSASWLENFICT